MTTWLRGTLRDDRQRAEPGPLVVKLGGSLLARPQWHDAVGPLLDALPGPRLVVVGGGPLVDGLRACDAAACAPPDVAHRLAIDLMGVTARFAAALLDLPLVGAAAPAHATGVLDVPAWLGRDEHRARLPVGWHVTSDSIAACVSAAHGGRLLLVKSAPPPGPLDEAVAAGWIDGHFPVAAKPLRFIGWAAPAPAA